MIESGNASMRGPSRIEWWGLLVYALFFTVGSVGHHFEATRGLMLALTPWTLLLFGASVLLPEVIARNYALLAWAAATYALTFALEAIGVATGVIFGAYRYGATLGFAVAGVPLIIGYNWVVVVLASILIVRAAGRRLVATTESRAVRIFVALASPAAVGLLAVAFDFILEPVAIGFDYWRWDAVAVPIRNYLAWFAVATVVSVPFFACRIYSKTRLPIAYLIVQTLFIASLLPLTR